MNVNNPLGTHRNKNVAKVGAVSINQTAMLPIVVIKDVVRFAQNYVFVLSLYILIYPRHSITGQFHSAVIDTIYTGNITTNTVPRSSTGKITGPTKSMSSMRWAVT